MVEITVGLITKRSDPHIDWALESLKKQTFPHKDFEYIIVDGYYHRRKDEVAKLIKDMNLDFPVLHIPDKASRWKGQRPCISNARNTVIIFANGKYIVHADDCCKMKDNWLERHSMWLKEGYLSAGGWIGCQDITLDGKCIEGTYGPEQRLKMMNVPLLVDNRMLYGGNFGYPLEAALDINGFDEYLDGELGQDDVDFGIRLARKGYRTIFDPFCMVEYYLMTHNYDKMVEPINRRLKSGVYHFANELAMQELLQDNRRTWTRGNTIDLRRSRELFGTGNNIGNGFGKWKYPLEDIFQMMQGFIDGNPIDWRDGKLIEEKLKNEPKWEMK